MRASLMFFEIEMFGAYSDIQTHKVVTLEERETEQGDAPCYNVIDQEEFDASRDQLTRETLEFC